jgi:hypothetical protein
MAMSAACWCCDSDGLRLLLLRATASVAREGVIARWGLLRFASEKVPVMAGLDPAIFPR